jgi:MFS family permease
VKGIFNFILKLHPFLSNMLCLHNGLVSRVISFSAFAYSQGVEPWILGILAACGALTGMVGAICFPSFCARFGLRKTGVLGFTFQTTMLSLCLVSIFLPGSPFKVPVMVWTISLELTSQLDVE